ncbi:MAG TPA: hypothetical protein IAA08_06385 [Candidatus Eubacterium avistercoris]|uniref:AAA+ ATPase domain-containing protein n=1 Tax=Candidatus Eubacterium avistercoris TaxID=2838567 RepID=A0A9D2D331_9FIRM|nr:hypothetical protein [Candidatus Eubacterium avistercoris]
MDKYEYKLKLEQLKNLVAEEEYEAAAELADTINWKKVRNVTTLCMVGDIYDKMDRYEDSREVLLMAYDHAPIGRNIVYKLANLAIKAKDVEAAEEYYNEFSEIASSDTKKYILRYKISCLKDEPLENRISILEELKEKEYTEEWAYELASLYSKADMAQKCVEACDELILWFGDGEYVEKALELKMLYQPLTKAQEEKYLSFHAKGKKHQPSQEKDEAKEENTEKTQQKQEEQAEGNRFSTANLQEELAKSMQQIMRATRKTAVSDTMDSVKKMVEDIPYLKLDKDQEETPKMNEEILNEQIDNSLKTDFEEFLAEDSDGQLSMDVPSSPLVEEQVDGQMSIAEVLAEWEKTKRAAEAAIAVAEQKKLEIAKRKALQETQELLEKLREVTPILEAGLTPKELLEKEYLEKIPETAAEETSAQAAEAETGEEIREPEGEETQKVREPEGKETQEVQEPEGEETQKVQEPEGEKIQEVQESGAEEPQETEPEEIEARETGEPEKTEVQEEPVQNAEGSGEEAKEPETVPEEETEEQILDDAHKELLEEIERIAKASAGIDKILSGEAGIETAQDDEFTDVVKDGETPEEGGQTDQTSEKTDASQESEKEKEAEGEKKAETDLHKTIEQATKVMQENSNVEISQQMPDSVSLPDDLMAEMIEPEPIQEEFKLTKEQRELFSYFLPVPGMEEQICQVMVGAMARAQTITSLSGNIVIQGPEGSGKTVLATSLIKAIQLSCGDEDRKIGKISAKALNKKDFAALVPKLEGGYLIIEKAGNLLPETVDHMAQVMQGNTQGLVVVLEDTKSGIKKVMDGNYSFAKLFTEKINIPIFTIDELVDFAKSYAEEMECTIDEMGVLALYNRISNIQKLERATTLTEVREIVDEAIERAEKGGIKKAFGVLFSKKYNENDYLILREKDFE